MQSIMSIQSHVVFGYVGNKAATYPLQSLGYDVWPINTVQFSNHTGYKKWQGEVCSAKQIKDLSQGIIDIEQAHNCIGILSGYMGNQEIAQTVYEIVEQFKHINPNILYLCDPVIGNSNCYVKDEVKEFFKSSLKADIITPNHDEAQVLSGIEIICKNSLKKALDYFLNLGIKIAVITGINLKDNYLRSCVAYENNYYWGINKKYDFSWPINGTGDAFSALYLGYYLQDKNPQQALAKTIYAMQIILESSFEKQSKELCLVGIDYKKITNNYDVITKF